MIRIRPLLRTDFSALYELGTHLFRPEDELPSLLHALDVCFLELSHVAVENGRILGFTVLCPSGTTVPLLHGFAHSVELAFFGVSSTCQGRGIGSRLLKETLHTLFQRSYSSIWLLVDVSNDSAIRMYEKHGFCRYGRMIPYAAPEACWIMGLTHHTVFSSQSTQYHEIPCFYPLICN